jgi:integrase
LGRAANTIKSYISALGKYLPLFDGVQLGQHRLVAMFLAGCKNLRRPPRHTVPSWDLDLVLKYLAKAPFEPMSRASLQDWTFKTVLLIALASAARVSELAALDCNPPYTMVRQGFASLKHCEEFVPKVPSSANVERTINLKALDSVLCPVRALRHYLQISKAVRSPGTSQLFVTVATGRQGKPVQPSTISGWLVRVIRGAYLDAGKPLPVVKAHSTRKMATSKAWVSGASCEEICAAATWSSGLTFAQFYKLDMPPPHLSSISSRVLSATVGSQESGLDSDSE